MSIDNSPKDYEATTPYETKLQQNTWSLDDGAKRFRHMEWLKVFDEQLKSSPLSIQSADPLFSLPLGEHADTWEVWLSKEDVWSRYYTLSHIANLKGEQLEVSSCSAPCSLRVWYLTEFQQTKKHVFEILAEAPTNEKGEVAIHGRTLAWWTTAVPSFPIKEE